MKENDFMKKLAETIAFNRNKRAFDRSMMHPERDWFVAVFAVLIVIVASALWNFTQYQGFSRVSVGSAESNTGSSVYNGGAVFTALTELEERAKEYSKLKNEILGRRTPVGVPEVIEESEEELDQPVDVQEEVPELIEDPAPAQELEVVEVEGEIELAI
jgi:hypothetical protein